MQLSDEQREEAKKIILRLADNLKNGDRNETQKYFAITFIAEKIKNNEPVSDELLQNVYLTEKIFSLFGFRYE